jgi:hypothetical protein
MLVAKHETILKWPTHNDVNGWSLAGSCEYNVEPSGSTTGKESFKEVAEQLKVSQGRQYYMELVTFNINTTKWEPHVSMWTSAADHLTKTEVLRKI